MDLVHGTVRPSSTLETDALSEVVGTPGSHHRCAASAESRAPLGVSPVSTIARISGASKPADQPLRGNTRASVEMRWIVRQCLLGDTYTTRFTRRRPAAPRASMRRWPKEGRERIAERGAAISACSPPCDGGQASSCAGVATWEPPRRTRMPGGIEMRKRMAAR